VVCSWCRPFPKLGGLGAIAQLGERLLCKQEVTGSIPVGSIEGSACKAAGFGVQVVLDWYSSLAESTAGEYHIGPYFAGGLGFGGLQAGGHRFDPGWMEPTDLKSNRLVRLLGGRMSLDEAAQTRKQRATTVACSTALRSH
jgi:hypothetical protein